MTALLVSVALGMLSASGLYLMLRARTFDLVLGLTLLSYAVNLFLFFMGRLASGAAPIIGGGRAPTLTAYADPLPQALVLTAIVIGFAMTALLLVVALRTRAETGSDHVDGNEPQPPERAERRAAPKPAPAGRETRPALGPSVPAQAGTEPRPSFPSRGRPTYPSDEGLH